MSVRVPAASTVDIAKGRETAMARTAKSRSRKSRIQDAHARALRQIDAVKMRRYLAFVRAVVGVSARAAGR